MNVLARYGVSANFLPKRRVHQSATAHAQRSASGLRFAGYKTAFREAKDKILGK
jgi:hypothetical protein